MANDLCEKSTIEAAEYWLADKSLLDFFSFGLNMIFLPVTTLACPGKSTMEVSRIWLLPDKRLLLVGQC